MKRIFFVLMLVVMLSMAAVVSFASASPDDYHRRRTPTPRPRPTATSPSVALTAPTLLSPANGETRHTGNLIFTWNPVPGAARYHIQAGGIIDYWSLTEPSYTFNVTSGFVTYYPRLYWRVQAIDANHVQGPWSEWSVINLVSP